MYRNKKGELVFANAAEEKAYNDKKQKFLSQSDEQNAAQYERELLNKYGLITPEKVVEIPSKPEIKVDKNLLALAEEVALLEKKVNALTKLVK